MSCCLFRLAKTGMTQKGKNLLAEFCKTQENLDVNFMYHAGVWPKKGAKNVT